MLVSALSYGNWITHGSQIEEDAAAACVKAALDVGITTFDTADVYAIGAAESVLGRALKHVRRESVEIFTKVYWPTGPNPNDRGLSRKHIIESLHSSLGRLQTDHVDLLQAHRYDYAAPLEETLRAFDDLVRQGKVHYIGVSEWTAEQISDALRMADEMGFDRIVSNQPQYSMIWRGDRGRGRPALPEGGCGPDRLVTPGAGRPDRQVPARRVGTAPGLAGDRPRGRRNELAPARRGPRAGAGLRRALPRGRLHAGVGGPGLGPAERERQQRHRRGQPGPSRSPRTSRRSTSCSSPTSWRRSSRRWRQPRSSTPVSRSARPPGPDAGRVAQPGAPKREVNERTSRVVWVRCSSKTRV